MDNPFEKLVAGLKDLLKLDEATAHHLAELLEDRIVEIVEDRLDRENNRGAYRSDW